MPPKPKKTSLSVTPPSLPLQTLRFSLPARRVSPRELSELTFEIEDGSLVTDFTKSLSNPRDLLNLLQKTTTMRVVNGTESTTSKPINGLQLILLTEKDPKKLQHIFDSISITELRTIFQTEVPQLVPEHKYLLDWATDASPEKTTYIFALSGDINPNTERPGDPRSSSSFEALCRKFNFKGAEEDKEAWYQIGLKTLYYFLRGIPNRNRTGIIKVYFRSEFILLSLMKAMQLDERTNLQKLDISLQHLLASNLLALCRQKFLDITARQETSVVATEAESGAGAGAGAGAGGAESAAGTRAEEFRTMFSGISEKIIAFVNLEPDALMAKTAAPLLFSNLFCRYSPDETILLKTHLFMFQIITLLPREPFNFEALSDFLTKNPGVFASNYFLNAAAGAGQMAIVDYFLPSLPLLSPPPSLVRSLASAFLQAMIHKHTPIAERIIPYLTREIIEISSQPLLEYFKEALPHTPLSEDAYRHLYGLATENELESIFTYFLEKNDLFQIQQVWEYLSLNYPLKRIPFFELLSSAPENVAKNTFMTKTLIKEYEAEEEKEEEEKDKDTLALNLGISDFHIMALIGNLSSFQEMEDDNTDFSLDEEDPCFDETPLHFGVRGNSLPIVKHLADETEVPLDSPNGEGIRPIDLALMLKSRKMTEALLSPAREVKTGLVDINRVGDPALDTRLSSCIAIQFGYDIALIKKVIQEPCAPNEQNLEGNTIFHHLLRHRFYRTFIALLEDPLNFRRFDLTIANAQGQTYEEQIQSNVRDAERAPNALEIEALEAIRTYQAKSAEPSPQEQRRIQEEARLKAADERAEAFKKENDELRARIDVLVAEITEARDSSARLASHATGQQLLLAELGGKWEASLKDMTKMESAIGRLQTKLQQQYENKREADALETTLKDKVRDLEKTIETLRSDHERDVTRLNTSHQEKIATSEILVQRLISENLRHSEESKKLQAEIERLQGTLEAKKAEIQRIRTATQEEVKSTQDSHQKVMAETQSKILELEEKIQGARTHTQEEIREIQRSHDEAILALRASHQEELAQARAQIQDMEASQKQSQEELGPMKIKLIDAEARHAAVMEELKDAQARVRDLETTVQVLRSVPVAAAPVPSPPPPLPSASRSSSSTESTILASKVGAALQRMGEQITHLSNQMASLIKVPERLAEETRDVVTVCQHSIEASIRALEKRLEHKLATNVSLRITDDLSHQMRATGITDNKRVLGVLTTHIQRLTTKVVAMERSLQPAVPESSPPPVTSLVLGNALASAPLAGAGTGAGTGSVSSDGSANTSPTSLSSVAATPHSA